MTDETPKPEIAKPAQVANLETQLVHDRFAKANTGEIVAYTELETLIGRSVRIAPGRSRVSSARRMILRTHGFVFDVVPNQGYRRLDEHEKADHADRMLDGIRRLAHLAIRELTSTITDQFTEEQKQRHNRVLTRAGIALEMLSAGTERKIVKLIENEPFSPVKAIRQLLE